MPDELFMNETDLWFRRSAYEQYVRVKIVQSFLSVLTKVKLVTQVWFFYSKAISTVSYMKYL